MLEIKMRIIVILSALLLGLYGYSIDPEKGAMIGVFLAFSLLYILVMLQRKYNFSSLKWMFKIEGENEKST